MKRVSPSRMRWYSSATGSLTLSTRSAAAPHVVGGVEDRRPGRDVLLVHDLGAGPGALLDEHLVAVLHQLVGSDRGDRDAVLVVLDFLRYADLHLLLSPSV